MHVDLEGGDGAVEDVGAAPGPGEVTARVRDRVVAVHALPVRVAKVEVECPATKILALEIVPVVTESWILFNKT